MKTGRDIMGLSVVFTLIGAAGVVVVAIVLCVYLLTGVLHIAALSTGMLMSTFLTLAWGVYLDMRIKTWFLDLSAALWLPQAVHSMLSALLVVLCGVLPLVGWSVGWLYAKHSVHLGNIACLRFYSVVADLAVLAFYCWFWIASRNHVLDDDVHDFDSFPPALRLSFGLVVWLARLMWVAVPVVSTLLLWFVPVFIPYRPVTTALTSIQVACEVWLLFS